ncbi:MAG: carbonic anhydrase [Flavobacteriaceae bacterium]|jgi:carbonic anhydrase|uniref:carbonic anhydrase n=1 Tax=Candidatus Marifrigoribacter sp. Uisw_064 TaxID=3230970 RepID=UPI003AE89495
MEGNNKEGMSPPALAQERLREGNRRFVASRNKDRDLMTEVKATAGGQTPFATILHCIDSRVSAELIFDQGVGDLFSVRVAGNIINQDILGSLEFANIASTSKIIVVMGHTSCGAVGAACNHARFDDMVNLNKLIRMIEPAVTAVTEPIEQGERNSGNTDFLNRVARKNVELTVKNLKNESRALALRAEDPSQLKIVGAMYDVSTGVVEFFNDEENS